MKWRFLLPAAYIVVGLVLVFLFGGAGHGWGGEAFFFLSVPAAFLIQNTKEIVLWCFLVGIIQWTLIGYFVERLLAKRSRSGKNIGA